MSLPTGPQQGPPSAPRASVLHLAWPLILSFWMRQLFAFVDTYFAAAIGDHAVAGIGLASPYEFLLIAFWVGASTGMTSLLSNAMGAHQGERIEQIIRTTRRVVAVLIPVFFVLGGLIWMRPLWFVADGMDPATVGQFRIYASVIVAGTALTGFWAILPDSIVKAHHDTKATMWAGIWSNLLNVGLNCVFVYIFHWGMFGIAFSTVIGRLAGLAYALARAGVHEAKRRAAALDVVPGRETHPLRALMALAVPAAMTYMLMATESAIVNKVLAQGVAPTESVAAYSIYYRWVMFFLMPVIACGVALLPFVARLNSRGDVAGMRRAWREVVLAACAYVALVVTPVALLLPGPLVAHLAQADATRALAASAIALCPLACLVAIPFFACRPIFEGLRRGGPGLVMAGLRYAVLTLPCAFFGARLASSAGRPPLLGLLLGLIVATAVSSTVFIAWMLRALRHADAAAVLPEPGAPG